MIIENSTVQILNLTSSNQSINLTLKIISEMDIQNHVLLEKTVIEVLTPIITLIIGALITLTITYIQNYQKEQKELLRYEYGLISEIIRINDEISKSTGMVSYYQNEKRNPLFYKINHYKTLMVVIKKIMQNQDVDVEELKVILKEISKKI